MSRPPTWDTRAVFIERQQRWWWNAWRESTATELYGFADSAEEASQAMYRAIDQAGAHIHQIRGATPNVGRVSS